MAELKIGQVARQSGLSTSALRYYERLGLLPEPVRRSGQRIYDDSVFPRLSLIRLAQRAGFSLAEIRLLMQEFTRSASPAQAWEVLARDKLAEVEERIARAQAARQLLLRLLGCECSSFEACVVQADEEE